MYKLPESLDEMIVLERLKYDKEVELVFKFTEKIPFFKTFHSVTENAYSVPDDPTQARVVLTTEKDYCDFFFHIFQKYSAIILWYVYKLPNE